MKAVCRNRKAYHDYIIEDTLEAGIALLGTEVKSLRDGRVNLKDSYVMVGDGEAVMRNCHISPYSHGNVSNHEPTRPRKLLLHKREIKRLRGKVAERGYSVIPLRIYFKGPRAKVEVGLARGKKFFEKRESIKRREAEKEMQRALKASNR
jgi:SsrA-binding protein